MSGRYSVMPDEKWAPALPEDIRGQGQGNKQVGNGKLDVEAEEDAFIAIESANHNSQLNYQELLNLGVCREQARAVLPQGQYTEGVVTANLGDWMLLLKQRLDHHAQLEIQVYAQAIEQILNQLFPICMEAFRDYQLNRVIFSAQEMVVLHNLLVNRLRREPAPMYVMGRQSPANSGARLIDCSEWLEEQLPNKREREEFLKKINYV